LGFAALDVRVLSVKFVKLCGTAVSASLKCTISGPIVSRRGGQFAVFFVSRSTDQNRIIRVAIVMSISSGSLLVLDGFQAPQKVIVRVGAQCWSHVHLALASTPFGVSSLAKCCSLTSSSMASRRPVLVACTPA
jgi:hypothetical protein